MQTIAVIGAGASGMAAAIEASKDNNNRVILFERQQRVGRKLLSTGNGRCNLTNTGAAAENYFGENPDFTREVLKKYPPSEILAFFHSLGLVTSEEYGGRVYPFSNSANSVVDVLRFALDKPNLELRTSSRVIKVVGHKGGFVITTDEDGTEADRVIVACGGCAGGKLGGVKDGYEILAELGHKRTGLYPSLVQITTDPTFPRALKGVRAEAELRLSGAAAGCSRGEILFTEKGVSGPAAFDISRRVSCSGDGKKELHIDLLPGFDRREISDMLNSRKEALPALPADEILTGILHNRLGRMIVKFAKVSGAESVGELNDSELKRIAEACRDFVLPVKGTEGFESAQVTAGGIRTSEFRPDTLESRIVRGLYACGEVLDVDGECGGYNLQWAWASGITAGRLGK